LSRKLNAKLSTDTVIFQKNVIIAQTATITSKLADVKMIGIWIPL